MGRVASAGPSCRRDQARCSRELVFGHLKNLKHEFVLFHSDDTDQTVEPTSASVTRDLFYLLISGLDSRNRSFYGIFSEFKEISY